MEIIDLNSISFKWTPRGCLDVMPTSVQARAQSVLRLIRFSNMVQQQQVALVRANDKLMTEWRRNDCIGALAVLDGNAHCRRPCSA